VTNALTLLSREGVPAWVDPERMRELSEHPALADGLPRPELWLFATDAEVPPYRFASETGDVYELLSEFARLAEMMPHYSEHYAGAVLYTSGWAAPLRDGEPDGAPSAHPLRRRVYLAVCVTREDTASRLFFSDTAEIVDDPGQATGSLAEAVAECVASRLGGAS
jgi:hypothetical protein